MSRPVPILRQDPLIIALLPGNTRTSIRELSQCNLAAAIQSHNIQDVDAGTFRDTFHLRVDIRSEFLNRDTEFLREREDRRP